MNWCVSIRGSKEAAEGRQEIQIMLYNKTIISVNHTYFNSELILVKNVSCKSVLQNQIKLLESVIKLFLCITFNI